MAKNPARLNDSVSNNLHGDGEITSGATAVSFQGQAVACEGDSAKFADGTTGTIQASNACVLVNGKRVALIGDQTTEDGILNAGASGIKIDEGEPFLSIGNNVHFGANIIVKCGPKPAFNQHFELYDQTTGKNISGIDYIIKSASKGLISGLLNQGQTQLTTTQTLWIRKVSLMPPSCKGNGLRERGA